MRGQGTLLNTSRPSSYHEAKPDFKAPPLACDSHFHVFGPVTKYPYGSDIRYPPPLSPVKDYLALAHQLGFERHVFVQPSAYGRDNSCMLDAMREVGSNCRGIVDIDENVPDAELARLHKAGVRGVRVNVSPVKPPEAGFGAKILPRIQRLDSRLAELGWKIDFLMPGWLTREMMGTLGKLRADFMLAHMGMFLARDGVSQPGFPQLVGLLRHGEGHCWIKLSGIYRFSVAAGYADAAPMVRALIEAAPDRVIWGSDYPHLSFGDRVGSVEMFNLFGRWVPDEEIRRRILVDNPQRLFSF